MSPKMAQVEDLSGNTYELDRGEQIVFSPPSAEHELIKHTIGEILGTFVRQRLLGRVLIEASYQVDDASFRRPDVSFLRHDRIGTADRKKPFTGAPELAIEIVYPADSRRLLSRKVRHYLETGAQIVWVLYPDSLEVNVITKSLDDWLGPDDTLDAPTLLPGFTVQVRMLFQ